MIINVRKSTISFVGVLEEERTYFSQLFPFLVVELELGLEYQSWFITKVEK
jgi:hypothetical protein